MHEMAEAEENADEPTSLATKQVSLPRHMFLTFAISQNRTTGCALRVVCTWWNRIYFFHFSFLFLFGCENVALHRRLNSSVMVP